MGISGGLPTRAAELTAAWLSHVLGHRVDSFELEDIGTGVGIFGEITRVRLAGDPLLPHSLIAKFPTADPNNRPTGDALGIYEREVRFFRDIAPGTELRLPHAYFADMDAATGAFVLLLEDLARFEMGDQVAGVSVARAERIVDGLADLHATWWERPELYDLEWLPSSADPAYLAAVPAIYAAGLPVLERDWADVIGPEALEAARRVAPVFTDIVMRTGYPPCTFIHTDSRLDNFFFEGDDPIFIDFQLAVRGRGPADVAYLVGSSMEIEDQVHWEALLHRYHERLLAKGVTEYSWEQCLRDYRESVLYYICSPMSLIGTFDAGNERGAQLTHKFVTRVMAHVVNSDACSVI